MTVSVLIENRMVADVDCFSYPLWYRAFRYSSSLQFASQFRNNLQDLQPKYKTILYTYINPYPANVENRVSS